jgi:hypothetical protein
MTPSRVESHPWNGATGVVGAGFRLIRDGLGMALYPREVVKRALELQASARP